MDSSVELVKHLLQSVVYIHTTVGREQSVYPHPRQRAPGQRRRRRRLGLILTVNYVVMGGQTIYVAFQKGRRVKAELVAQDFEIGLALIRVNRQGPSPPSWPPPTPSSGATRSCCWARWDRRSVARTGGLVTYIGRVRGVLGISARPGHRHQRAEPGLWRWRALHDDRAPAGTVSLNLNEIARSSLAIPVDFYRTHRDEMLRSDAS